MKEIKKEPRRIIVGIIAVIVIIFMWVNNDVLGIFGNISGEEALPFIMTNAAVMIGKILFITVGIILLRWIITKIKNRK